MADLDKDTVDFRPTFDETSEEPTVLPTPFPNLLVNGSTGIAVGMATSIPPHNMREVIDGRDGGDRAPHGADERSASARCSQAVPGPGLPVGRHDRRPRRHLPRLQGRPRRLRRPRQGDVRGAQEGRSRVDRHHRDPVSGEQEEPDRGNRRAASARRRSKASPTCATSRAAKACGSSIELKRGELPDVVLNNLYKHTKLQMGYGITLLAIVARPAARAEPARDRRAVHRVPREVVRRRTEFELRKAEARAHILEGLKIALDHLDEVIKLIRGSKNPVEARAGLDRRASASPRSRRRRSSTCSCSA